MSSDTFRVIHRLYKRLNRIKTLVEMQSSNLSTSVDVFEVFSAQLKELLFRVETESINDDYSQSDKLRLAAIQLSLHFDHLDSLVQSACNHKISSVLISIEVQKMENRIQSFDAIASNDIIFLSYFKMLHLLARINYDYLKNFSVSKQWLKKAERLYLDVLSSQGEQTFYDNRELFSKSAVLKPSIEAFDIIDRLFSENVQLLELILQSEKSEINCLLQWLHTHQHTSVWLGKLLSIVPQLLDQNEFKIVAYFLLIARKVANEKDADWQVQSSMATSWMHYFFGVFDRSKESLLKSFPTNQLWRMLRESAVMKTAQRKRIHATGDCVTVIPRSTFNCFANSIPLTENELNLCANSLESVDVARNLLEFSVEMVNSLICDGDFRADPMNFIVHTYQMSDLMSISTILVNDPDECFHFQEKRFQYLQKMIKWIKKHCPMVFETLATTFLTDLNEILIDLYAANFGRIFKHLEQSNQDTRATQEMIGKKLIDLHDINALIVVERNDL